MWALCVMTEMTVDFIAKNDDESEWSLVLVEEGPWSIDEAPDELRRLQDRLYGCIDAIIDGKVAEVYPASVGKAFLIRLDGYNLPKEDIQSFFTMFSENVLETPDYKDELTKNQFVTSVAFEINLSEIH